MLPVSVGFEAEPDANGQRLIWLDAGVVDRLGGHARPGESYCDAILRLVELEGGGCGSEVVSDDPVGPTAR